MKKDQDHFSPKRIEEAAKTADVVARARAAAPLARAPAGRDILLGLGAGTLNLRSSDD